MHLFSYVNFLFNGNIRKPKQYFKPLKFIIILKVGALRSWSKREVKWEKEKRRVFEAKWLMLAMHVTVEAC